MIGVFCHISVYKCCRVFLLQTPADIQLDSGSSEGSDADSTTPLQQLNIYLGKRDVSPIRNILRTPWDQASGRTKRRYTQKAKEVVETVLKEIAPNDPDKLSASVKSSDASSKDEVESIDVSLLDALAECYKNAGHWEVRRQILSIMADKVHFQTLQKWIPELTRYR